MKLLRSYTLRELVVPFCVSLLIFTFIFIVGNLFKMADLIINKGVNIFDVLRIIILLIPRLLSFYDTDEYSCVHIVSLWQYVSKITKSLP